MYASTFGLTPVVRCFAQIGYLGATQQYVIITGILFFFTLLYGYLQELVSIHIFAREFGLFVTLLQVSERLARNTTRTDKI